MAAKDYQLAVSAFFGTVYITKVSKKNPLEMTDDRHEVPSGQWIKAIVEYADHILEDEPSGVYTFTRNGKKALHLCKPEVVEQADRQQAAIQEALFLNGQLLDLLRVELPPWQRTAFERLLHQQQEQLQATLPPVQSQDPKQLSLCLES